MADLRSRIFTCVLRPRLGASALLLAGLLALAGSASAQSQEEDDERARIHFEAGRSYFEESAYDRALEEFQRAFDLSHRTELLVNLALVHERLGHLEEAAQSLEQFIEASPDHPNRATYERRIENLRRLAAERAAGGGGGETGGGETGGGETGGGETGGGETGGGETGGGGNDGLLYGAIASYAVAGVGAVIMGALGGMALGEYESLRTGCGASQSCTEAEVADANTFALISDIGMGLAIAGAAAGTALLIVALTSSGSSGSEDQASLRLTPWAAPASVGANAGLGAGLSAGLSLSGDL